MWAAAFIHAKIFNGSGSDRTCIQFFPQPENKKREKRNINE